MDFEIWSVILLFLIGKLHAVLLDLTPCAWSPHGPQQLHASPEGVGGGGGAAWGLCPMKSAFWLQTPRKLK